MRWQRDDPRRRHEFNCAVCQREGFYRGRACYMRNREEVVHVPVFERHIPLPGRSRPRVLDLSGVLRLVSDIRRARSSSKAPVEPAPAFEVVWGLLRVCPSAFQYDATAQNAVQIGAMLESGYDVAALPADFVDLAQLASATMADYTVRKMDAKRKEAEAKSRPKGAR